MKKKGINPMMIGAALCAVAAIGVVWYMNEQSRLETDAKLKAQQEQFNKRLADAKGDNAKVNIIASDDTRDVVFANQEIAANSRIERVLLVTKPVPENLLENAYQRVEEVENKYARRNINPGEPLTPDNVSAEFQKMSNRLTPGMRAVALPVISQGDSTGGFATDGDRVDLIMIFQIQGAEGKKLNHYHAETVMQNVKILYMPGAGTPRTDQTTGVSPSGNPEIKVTTTFEVTPRQAEALALFSERGKIKMVLRHKDDDIPLRTAGFNTIDLAADPDMIQREVDRSYKQLPDIQAEIEAGKSNNSTNENPTTSPSNESILQP